MDLMRLLPKYWLQNHKTCDEWDGILNDALDKFEVKPRNEYTVIIGPLVVWASGFPYAYGMPFTRDDRAEIMPRVSTRIRLKKRLEPSQSDECARKNEYLREMRDKVDNYEAAE